MTAEPDARAALLIASVAAFFLVGAGMASFGPALPVFAREFGLTTAEAGWLVSIQWTGCLLGVVAMYFWSQRFTAQPGLALIALGGAMLAWSPNWLLTGVGAFVFGLGYGAVAAQFNPRVMVAYGPRGPSMLSLINAAFSLGAIAAPYGFVLMAESPRPVFGAMSVLAAVTVLVARRAGMTGVRPTTPGKGVRLHLPILGLIVLAIGIEASLSGIGPTALIRTGLTETEAAQLLSVLFVVALTTRLVLIGIADRIPAFALFSFAMLWAFGCALGAIFVSPAIFFPALGVSAGLFFQGGYVTAARKMGDDPRVASIILGDGLLGAILSPLIYTRLMDVLGNHGFFWLIAMVAGTASALSLAAYRSMSR